MASKTKERYILHKTDEAVGPKVCAFFKTSKGCKNGATCKFLHESESNQTTTTPSKSSLPIAPPPIPPPPLAPPPPPANKPVTFPPTPTPISSQPFRVPSETTTPKSEKKKRKSSSSEPEVEHKKLKAHHGEEEQKKQNPMMKTPKSEKQNGEKGHQNAVTTTPHSFVKSLPVTPFQLPNYRPADDDEDESSFLFSAVNHALAQDQVQTPDVLSTKKRSSTPSAPSTASVPSTQQGSSFSNFFLPVNEIEKINEMNVTSEKALQEKKKSKKSPGKFLIESQSQPHSDAPAVSFVPQPFVPQAPQTIPVLPSPSSQLTTPTSTHLPVDPRVSDWSHLVQQCANHSRYAKDYTFSTDSEWIQAKPYGEWSKSCPAIIAIDCEMCETTDPVTDAKNSSALVRVSIVDGVNPAEVLLDSLVAPNWPISEMRTRIHGIAESNLTGVAFTLRHAQAFLMKICSDQTIIVGHALHHDLRALKFQHKCVIDTSYLYTIENEPNSLLSLRDIAKHLYDQKLSIHHDSVQDAQVSLMLALHVKNNGPPAPIPRSSSHTSTIDETMLFIHRLPLAMNEEVIREMMMVLTNVIPSIVNPIQHSATTQTTPTGKTNAVFPSAAHANLCFDTLPGLDRPDKGGRSQKRVYLKGGGYICVRKA